MSFKTDGGGFAFSCDDGKICINASTWSTRLSQIGKLDGTIRITTYQLPDIDFIHGILSKRPYKIHLICHTTARPDALKLKALLPKVRIALNERCNIKMTLVAPETVWMSSADFGHSSLINSTVGLHTQEVHDKLVADVFNPMWENSSELG